MKKAFSKWYTYVAMILLVIVAAMVAIIPFFALKDPNVWPRVYISYVLLFSGVIYIGGGFIAQDIYRAIQRKKTNNWDFPLEDEYIETAWKIYLPFLLAGFALLLGGLISYPFLR